METNIQDYFVSLAAMVPLVTLLAAWINKLTNPTAGWVKQAISWVVAIVAGLFAWYAKLGIFADLSIYEAILYGLASGLAANGFFDIKVIQTLLQAFRLQPKKTK